MDPAAAKQQIAERVKQANNFLVTVNANPTVDQLAACIGLTLLLNKMSKHATAVFSGKVPNVIEFLEPEKTIQKNTDALRDFIISLDKNKADKLRYKVEDDVVKIFITPYRTSISQKDLVFSEGDFNVEVVMALGITDRTQIDAAITAHGRILHDATIVSLNTAAGKPPNVGQINWSDPAASSLSEMLVSISEAFGTGLIDAQIATAFLTGIVAETGRFSNKKTSPKVMTMSAQLMAAGANQQLIVSKLEPPPPPAPPAAPVPKAPPAPPKPPAPTKPEGIMDVSHEEEKPDGAPVEIGTTEIHIDEQGNLKTADQLAPAALPDMAPPPVELPPELAVPPPPSAEAEPPAEESHHAMMSAPPLTSEAAVEALENRPNWSTPYNLSPRDPYDAIEGQSPAQSEPKDEVAHGKDITPPADFAPAAPVGNARDAVQNALVAAPFDPAAAGPVAALNAQPMNQTPLHPQASPPLPSDTPSLVLPSGPQVPISTTPLPPLPPPPVVQDAEYVAPPPLPPPLVAAPGVIIPPPQR